MLKAFLGSRRLREHVVVLDVDDVTILECWRQRVGNDCMPVSEPMHLRKLDRSIRLGTAEWDIFNRLRLKMARVELKPLRRGTPR